MCDKWEPCELKELCKWASPLNTYVRTRKNDKLWCRYFLDNHEFTGREGDYCPAFAPNKRGRPKRTDEAKFAGWGGKVDLRGR